MKQSKKMLAMLLALVMVFTMLPVSALAAETLPFSVTIGGTEYTPEQLGTSTTCSNSFPMTTTATELKLVLPESAKGQTLTFGTVGNVNVAIYPNDSDTGKNSMTYSGNTTVTYTLSDEPGFFCLIDMTDFMNSKAYHLAIEYEDDAASNEPSVNVSSAEAKPGDEVTLTVSLANRPDLMAMSFTVAFDETRLEKVEYIGSGMGGGTWETSGKTLIWYNMSGDTVYPDGQILELKYKVKDDAPAGDAEVKVTVKENYNWDEDAFEFTFTPGKVTVAACEHPNTTTTYTQVNGTQTHTGTTTCDTCGATTATVPAADCADADNNQKCDTCGGDVLPATVTFPFELTVDGEVAEIEVLTTSENCTVYGRTAMMLKVVLPADAQTLGMNVIDSCNVLTRVNSCSGTMTPYYPERDPMSYDLSNGIDYLCLNISGGSYNSNCYHITFEKASSGTTPETPETPDTNYPFSVKVDGAAFTLPETTDSVSCRSYGSATELTLKLPADATNLTITSSVTMGLVYPDDSDNRSDLPNGESKTYSLSDFTNYLCFIDAVADKAYHIVVEREGASISLPFNLAVDGEAITAAANGDSATCSKNTSGGTATPIKVVLPQSAKGKTLAISSSTAMGIVTLNDGDTLGAFNYFPSVTPVNYTLPEESVTLCINMTGSAYYHLTIEYEGGSDTPAAEGYTVSMPADIEVMTGETVSVPVVIDNGDVDTYNAFDISFTYDSDVLELTSTTIEGMTVTNDSDNGIVTVQRYGSDLNTDSTAFTLTFQANGTGETTVAIDDTKPVKVGIASNAHELDASDATVVDTDTKVTIGGYTVTLPDDFTGEGTVKPGDDYTFEAKDKNYNYTFTGSTMGGDPVTVKDNGDGTFTVENVSGNVVITSEKTGKLFAVTLGEDMTAEKSGEDAAQYMTPYVATLTKEAGYGYNVTVTINNIAYTGFEAKDNGDGTVTYTIPGAAITGDIVFDSGKEAGDFTVTVEGTGAGDVTYEATAEGGKPYSFTVTKAANYTYTVSATMGGEKVDMTEADGTYTIAKVTGDIVITVNKTTELTVEVSQYLELDGKTIFLVKVPGTLEEGKAYAYNGETMYYSNVYDAWSWLVIVEEGQTFTAEDALAKLAVVDAQFTTLDRNCDVNMTDKVDVNDAQLVYNMYNCHYDNFDVVSIEKFLYADTTGDGTVNTQDATAIVAAILAERNQG